MSHQVEAVREECNKNIVVMAEEIKALETVSNILIANRTFSCYCCTGVCREEQLTRESS